MKTVVGTLLLALLRSLAVAQAPSVFIADLTWTEVRFARKDCTPCAHRAQCTRSKKEPRIVGLQAREHYEALHTARQHQTTEAFYQQYAPRAGIEGTHAQGIRRCGLRQSRYIGLARRIYNISPPLRLSTSCDWENGGQGHRRRRHATPPLHA